MTWLTGSPSVRASETTGRGPGDFTMSMSPTTATLGETTTVSVSGSNAIPNTRVDISIDGQFVITMSTSATGTYAASFDVQPDGTVTGNPDSPILAAGDHLVTVALVDCGCGDPRSATLTVA